jgi:tetratricopeptide (TPR) repeat protein
VRARPTSRPWEDVLVDLRVDDHPEPLPELRRLLGMKRAYDRLERAEELELAGDAEGALRERRLAIDGTPDNPEAAFWTAISLEAQGRPDEARPLVALAVAADPGWAELLRRLADRGLVPLTPEAAEDLLPPVG